MKWEGLPEVFKGNVSGLQAGETPLRLEASGEALICPWMGPLGGARPVTFRRSSLMEHLSSFPSRSGVFVKLRERHRHPECYVCTDCGTNLKQKGHFFVEDQIYCEKHARERVTPPEGYDVITVFPK